MLFCRGVCGGRVEKRFQIVKLIPIRHLMYEIGGVLKS